jgi:glycosidase
VRFVRHPNNPELYDWHPTLGRIGFYNTNLTTGVLASNVLYENYNEDVWMYLMRTVRWLVDRTKVDGLRLDAVKHVPSYFFGAQGPARTRATPATRGRRRSSSTSRAGIRT